MGPSASNAFLFSDLLAPALADAAGPPAELEPLASVESLARVHEELTRLLEAVPRALQRLRRAATPADGDAAAVQQLAVRQLRQAAGALRIAGFEQSAQLPQAAAALLEPAATRGELAEAAVVEGVEQGCAALLAYLRRWRAGLPLSPLALFPAWSRLRTLAGAERIHPADLWPVPWRWQALPADERLPPLQPDDAARTAAEQLTLALMRDARSPAAARLGDLFAALARGAADGRMATLWGLAAAVCEGQAKGLLTPDVHLKRLAARLLAQVRRGPRAAVDDPTQRLAHDLLFFCAQAGEPARPGATPRLAVVRAAWGLQRHPAVDMEHALPAAHDAALLAQSLRQIATAQALWDGAAAGTPHPGLAAVFAQLAQALSQLLPKEELAVQALGQALQQAAAVGTPWTALALEVAQALLALQWLLQEADPEPPGAQLQRLATRIAQVLASDPLDATFEHLPVEPWLLALAQRGAEHQALAALGQSLRAAINEAGLQIDALALAADEATLHALGQRLQRLEGVLAQLSRPALAQGMRQLREALPPQAQVLDTATAERLAQRLAALDQACERLALSLPPAEGGDEAALEAAAALAAPSAALAPARSADRAEPPGDETATDVSALPAAAAAAPPSPGAPDQAPAPLPAAAAPPTFEPASERPAELPAELPAEPALEPPSEPVSESPSRPGFGTAAEPATAAPPAHPPVLVERFPLPELSELAAAAPWTGAQDALPELVELAPPVMLNQPVADSRVELATLLKQPDAQGAALSSVQASPESDRAALPRAGTALSSRAVALARLKGTSAAQTLPLAPRVATPAGALEAPRAEVQVETWAPAAAATAAVVAPPAEPGPAVAGEGLAAAEAQPSHVPPEPEPEPAAAAPEAADLAADLAAAAPAPQPVATSDAPMTQDLAEAPAAPAPAEPVEAAGEAVDAHPPVALEEEPLLAADTDAAAPVALSPEPAPAAPDLESRAGEEEEEAAAALLADSFAAEPWPDAAEPAPGKEPPAGATATDTAPSGAVPAVLPVLEPEPAEPAAAVEPPAEDDGLSFDLSFDLPSAPAPADEEPSFELSFDVDDGTDLAAPAPAPVPGAALRADQDAQETVDASLDFELDFDADADTLAPAPEFAPVASAVPQEAVEAAGEASPAEAVASLPPIASPEALAPLEGEERRVGPLRVPRTLFDMYLDETDALSNRLYQRLAVWRPPQALERELVVVAQAMEGMAATVGDEASSQLVRVLGDAMAPCRLDGYGTPAMAEALCEAVLQLRRMLGQFARGELPAPAEPALLQRLRSLHETAAAPTHTPFGSPQPDHLAASAALEAGPLPASDADGWAGEPGRPGRLEDDAGPLSPPDEASAAALPPLDLGEPAVAEPAVAQAAEAALPLSGDVPAPAAETLLWSEDETATAPPAGEAGTDAAWDIEDDDAQALDAALFPVFEEEVQELLPQLSQALRAWAEDRGAEEHAAAGMRALHTLKGGARLAGAMRLGDAAHGLESAIDDLVTRTGLPERAAIEALLARADALSAAFERLRAANAPLADLGLPGVPTAPPAQDAEGASAAGQGLLALAESQTEAAAEAGSQVPSQPACAMTSETAVPPQIDWSRFAMEPPPLPPAAAAASPAATVRVRAPALDRLVAQAGEVGIARARLGSEMQQLGASLADLDENLARLRGQLREVELQAETQLDSRLEATRQAAQAFDPLELDRYTRLQELARMMAESLDDMATVQHSLRQGLRGSEDELVALGRLAEELQEELLRARLVAFDSLVERLQRVLRQAAQEVQRQVRLDIEGGEVEIDRGVLERVAPAIEHLLRNAVVHGIEPPAERFMAGKPAEGRVLLKLTQEGAQVTLSCSDDGAGLDLPRIHRRAVERGLLSLEAQPDAATLQHLVFAPGFSTAERLSPLAGRGVGLDVVRAEVEALGGHIALETTPGQGSRFTLQLPLTTAVMPVLLLRCGAATVAVPSALVDDVLRVTAAEVQQAVQHGRFGAGIEAPAFYQLEPLLQQPPPPPLAPGRTATVLLLRGAQQRLALQVREVVGKQEAVLKPLGPQLATLPGLAGMSLLASGLPLPVYNPAALALRHVTAQQAAQVTGMPVHAAMAPPLWRGAAGAGPGGAAADGAAPLVLVVDDSLTVRRATQRLLEREGYRVALAKDGVQALQRLHEEVPALLLTDLEMPQLDGFDLLRRLREEPRWAGLPAIVITSRLAARHRELAASLGVKHYLGKPYAQDELLSLVARYSGRLQGRN